MALFTHSTTHVTACMELLQPALNNTELCLGEVMNERELTRTRTVDEAPDHIHIKVTRSVELVELKSSSQNKVHNVLGCERLQVHGREDSMSKRAEVVVAEGGVVKSMGIRRMEVAVATVTKHCLDCLHKAHGIAEVLKQLKMHHQIKRGLILLREAFRTVCVERDSVIDTSLDCLRVDIDATELNLLDESMLFESVTQFGQESARGTTNFEDPDVGTVVEKFGNQGDDMRAPFTQDDVSRFNSASEQFTQHRVALGVVVVMRQCIQRRAGADILTGASQALDDAVRVVKWDKFDSATGAANRAVTRLKLMRKLLEYLSSIVQSLLKDGLGLFRGSVFGNKVHKAISLPTHGCSLVTDSRQQGAGSGLMKIFEITPEKTRKMSGLVLGAR